jgi:hypothetical protein
VQFVERHLKLADRRRGHAQGQGSAVGVEQPIETTPYAIVIERFDLFGREPQQLWDLPDAPVGHAVQRLSREQHVLQQDQQPRRGRDHDPRVFRGQNVLQVFPQLQALQDAVD